jgi:hypothetical protein
MRESFEALSMGVPFPPPEASPLDGGGITTFSPSIHIASLSDYALQQRVVL